MIITVSKPISEILESLKGFDNVFVVGCAACAAKCQTGGEQAVENAVLLLEKEGKKVVGFKVLDTPCDIRIVKKDLAHSAEVSSSDAIIVLACGAGVQSIEKVIDKAVLPALNPLFIGTTERIGVYHEYCSVCGDCQLGSTGGICPVSRCMKGLVNGPCGGSVQGKCEVDHNRDCVWVLIYNKLKKQGREKDLLKRYSGPKNNFKPFSVNMSEKKLENK